jgi:hypothetical protein
MPHLGRALRDQLALGRFIGDDVPGLTAQRITERGERRQVNRAGCLPHESVAGLTGGRARDRAGEHLRRKSVCCCRQAGADVERRSPPPV